MKKIKYLALGAIFFTFLNGCLQVDTKVNLNSDGSGTIEETVVMKSEVINMMKEFAMAFDSTKSEEFNMFNEEELKNKASNYGCLLYTSPSPRDRTRSRMPSSA